MKPTRPHERFSDVVQLDPASVAAFAATVGDENPLHADSEAAARTRFGRPIASGPHTSSLLMALSARHFSRRGAMLGLGFSFQFKKPIYANERITLEWLVVSVRASSKLRGDVVDLRGRIVNERGETALGAKGRVLIAENL